MCALCTLCPLCEICFHPPLNTPEICYNTTIMNEKPQFVLPERNPTTHAVHRKQVWWQITLPLLLGCLVFALAFAGVIWAAAGASPEVTRWADISLIWLILPTLFFALLGLAVVVGLTILISKLLGVLPGYARLVQDSFKNIQAKALRVNNALVAPALKLKSWSAAARRARQVVSELLKPGQQQ